MNVVIVGAGPAGLFLAHQLLALNPGYQVQLYDANPNPTEPEPLNDRGFGLGLGARARQWLNSIEGLEEQLIAAGIEFKPGGLLLIPRRQLCALMLQPLLQRYGDRSADETARLSVHFNTAVVAVDLAQHQITVARESKTERVPYDLLVGADGVHSIVRQAMVAANPEELQFHQRQRPQVWKVLQLAAQPEQPHTPPRILQLRTRDRRSGLIFGACLPQKPGGWIALIFWQPMGEQDQFNPGGITTVEELQQLLQAMAPKREPALQLDPDQAAAFLAAKPGQEYWSQGRCYHDRDGRAVFIGDAAHAMFSLLGQGCTAAIADAVALSALLQQSGSSSSDPLAIVLPQFSAQQVAEGQAASDLGLLALVFYHRGLGVLYKLVTLLWVLILRQPSIFARLNQVDAHYVQVLRENRIWVWLAKQLFSRIS